MGIARKSKAAWIGVSGVARKFWPAIEYELQTANGASTSRTFIAEDTGDYLHCAVTANFSANTDSNRAKAQVKVTGFSSGSVINIVASWDAPNSYQQFHIWDTGSSSSLFSDFTSGDKQAITVTATGETIYIIINSGIKTGETAWCKVHSITVDGEKIYPQ